MSKKDGGAGAQAKQARADEQARQDRIRAGTTQINSTFDSQFNDDFYNKQRDNYLTFALPQLDDQYGKAQRDLTFALARDGNLESSARGYQFGQLQKTYDTNRTGIADTAQNYANQARSNVEDARGNLISSVNATGDATQAASSATARATALAQPVGYSPIADAFSTATGALSQQAQAERAQALSNGAYKAPYSTGLFGTSGAVKYG
ncbi:hypothetical protein HCU64_23735 [Methylobacterium sp. C25]|uniref:hypothetical protein n=1 Tax=Methylobacterium sp. C25 TaxID=2721622 RepID=UPI001F3E3EC7|nr:hypothetical protein [Methylobacterium sp. C25]MCE4226757.1 hypothetical protein [Methylobacterium sp. C25]